VEGGFFEDWFEDAGIVGTYYQMTTTTCAFTDGWRRLLGLGGEIIVFVVEDVTPSKAGCSFGPTHDWVLVDPSAFQVIDGNLAVVAHEIGHACGLIFPDMGHHPSPDNLMFAGGNTDTKLNRNQRAIVRTSRHCTVI